MKPSKATRAGNPDDSSLEMKQAMYICSDNLRSKAILWIWQLRDIDIIGVYALVSILALTQANLFPPIVVTAIYALLTIRFEDTSIMDLIRYVCGFFFTR